MDILCLHLTVQLTQRKLKMFWSLFYAQLISHIGICICWVWDISVPQHIHLAVPRSRTTRYGQWL